MPALGALLVGCPMRLMPHLPAVVECPGILVPTGEISGAFLLRQDIRLRSCARQPWRA